MSRHLSTEASPSENRRRVPYRLVYIGLGLVAVAAVLLAVAFGGGGEPTPLPDPIESLTPQPNDSALTQAILEVDLMAGYRAQIYVNGFPIPENEVVFVEPTGVHRWQPTPSSLVMQAWTPGTHTVRIVWDSLSGLPSPGEFEWTFRVQ
ncbi:MAG TPA: hypothetical protein VJ935_05855 [Acidimicrobiia bacterium]|nr:hypothetical protein [Acidimicrobiia bacterium]